MKFEKKVEILRIQKYSGRETPEFLEDVIKIAKGEAFEYLLGEVDFCGAKINLSLRPMIPRPETEHWVKQAIEEIQNGKSFYTLRVLDLFSGSGNIGLAILKNIPESTVDMIELDPKLNEQIEISILRNNIKKTRTRVLTGDGFEGAVGLYDYIFAVPPYVPPQMKEEVMKELSAESPLSFFDKEDGYYYHKQVLSHAKEFLKEGGTLYLEFDITQREQIEQLAIENGWTNYSFIRDPYEHEFVVVLHK
ncbi:MAG: methyltransferase [Candidatus Paceibacterota bacterium]|jgi:release factor glutamine methyltransferase